mmetsp:Transcript_665/g.1932  ORF Transcript_665/g.1932 Transcript_665/m.1932 type:complete len:509 (+) Transcript_665:116-1642(+)
MMLPSLVVVLAGSSSTPQRRRLDVLFEVLSRTHGGPSFISRSDLLLLRAAAARRFESAPREGEEAQFTDACEWVMSQLDDPHASFLPPERAEALSSRYHGQLDLGVRTTHEPVESRAKGGWRALRLPPRKAQPQTVRTIVSAVAERSPAALGGLRVGDEVLEVAGKALEASGGPEADALLQAEENERVPMLVRRAGCRAPIHLTLRCALLPPPSVSSRTVRLPARAAASAAPGQLGGRSEGGGHAAVLRIHHFGAGTAAELCSELRKLRARVDGSGSGRGGAGEPVRGGDSGSDGAGALDLPLDLRAVLFDLRDNDGGLLSASVASARSLLPRGAHVVSLQKRRRGSLRTVRSFRRRWYHRASPLGTCRRGGGRAALPDGTAGGALGSGAFGCGVPVIVLVNQQTASAAEIFAAALAHAGNALVLGTQTFGKGTSQAFVHLPGGHGLTFTVYSLAAGAASASHPLNDGVAPHVRWHWWSAVSTATAAADREIALAADAALRATSCSAA